MNTPSSSTHSPLALTTLNGEPRVYDLTLGERLGFERPGDIRKLIKRYEEKLNTFNHIATVARCLNLGNGAKREVQEYYLDQKQSLFVCMKSETDKAFEVQADVIRVYDAYLNGSLTQAVSFHPRAYFAAARVARGIDLARDAGVKQALIWELQALHTHLGLPFPALHLFGKDPGQCQLEI